MPLALLDEPVTEVHCIGDVVIGYLPLKDVGRFHATEPLQPIPTQGGGPERPLPGAGLDHVGGFPQHFPLGLDFPPGDNQREQRRPSLDRFPRREVGRQVLAFDDEKVRVPGQAGDLPQPEPTGLDGDFSHPENFSSDEKSK